MSISLEQFIASKPKHVRLGQWFVVCYCKAVKHGTSYHWESFVDEMFQADGEKAKKLIIETMNKWQWSTLPGLPSQT